MIDPSRVALAWTTIDPSVVAGEYNDFKKRKKGGVKECLPCWAELMADEVIFSDLGKGIN